MAKHKKKQPSKEEAKVHPDLKGLDLSINSFGEIVTNIEIDKINAFLNEHVEDIKLLNRDEENIPTPKNKKKKD